MPGLLNSFLEGEVYKFVPGIILSVCVLCGKRIMLFGYSTRLDEIFILKIDRKLGK